MCWRRSDSFSSISFGSGFGKTSSAMAAPTLLLLAEALREPRDGLGHPVRDLVGPRSRAAVPRGRSAGHPQRARTRSARRAPARRWDVAGGGLVLLWPIAGVVRLAGAHHRLRARGARVQVKTLASWIEAHGLAEPWRPLVATTTAWIASAAPAWANEEERALACMDLGPCFFILDDGDDPLARRDLERITAGESAEPSRPLQQAFASLFARLGERGATTHYL